MYGYMMIVIELVLYLIHELVIVSNVGVGWPSGLVGWLVGAT